MTIDDDEDEDDEESLCVRTKERSQNTAKSRETLATATSQKLIERQHKELGAALEAHYT